VARVVTIGVYGWELDRFLDALAAADVRLLIDVRQRRGVRGPEYAWANATRLQAALAGAGVDYRHHKDLAPTTELRHVQYAEDARQGVGKRSRERLSPAYVRAYTEEILDLAQLEPLIKQLPVHGLAALLCVETAAEACHRSLVARRLADRHGFEVINLKPSGPAAFDLA
jgi:uncharacterized protein (DUF488 family)